MIDLDSNLDKCHGKSINIALEREWTGRVGNVFWRTHDFWGRPSAGTGRFERCKFGGFD